MKPTTGHTALGMLVAVGVWASEARSGGDWDVPKDHRSADGKGFKDLGFDYDGAGHVLVVFSASREGTKERGGGSAFDDLSVVAVK
jgi:hypothetical protein